MAASRPVRIGCAGWATPSAYRALFGGGPGMLARYATRFDCVEINSSFYRPHRRTTYERWAASVPRRFRFSVKIPREISHEQRLRGSARTLERFLAESSGLGGRLGCLLLQLPPSLVLDPRSAAAFFAMLRRVVFDNTAHGHAAADAACLQELQPAARGKRRASPRADTGRAMVRACNPSTS